MRYLRYGDSSDGSRDSVTIIIRAVLVIIFGAPPASSGSSVCLYLLTECCGVYVSFSLCRPTPLEAPFAGVS